LGVAGDHLWLGGGSTALISALALAVGGPGTSAVYAWPSFIMYRLATKWAMSDAVEVPLADGFVHDLDAMAGAVGADTSVVYVCNPNNPTGTYVSAAAMLAFIDSIPESVLVVVDEAYHDFVAASDYASAIPVAADRGNVVVLRTFSKVHALAGLRVGYAVAHPATIAELRKAQAPFTVTLLGQVAATESLRQTEAIAQRVQANAAGRAHLLSALAGRELPHAPSETNFVFFKLGNDSARAAGLFTAQGVIIRPLSGGWIRVTVGLPEENERFVASLDSAPFRIFRGNS
jgi:histidinol-phosphate aminotransferase